MPKMNCNIIRDLLPSYLDELCSIESNKLVEEHFNECTECQKLYEQTKLELQHNEHQNTTKEIDYLKTIHINVNKKNKIMLLITAILFLIDLYLNFYDYRFGNVPIVSHTNFIFPVLIAGVLFAVLPDYTKSSIPNRIKLPVLGIEFIVMTYIFTLTTYVCHGLLNNRIPFGLATEEIGPFLSVQILSAAIGFTIAFVGSLLISLRQKAICPSLYILPLIGLSLMLEYEHLLHELSTRFVLSMFIKPYIILLCEMFVLLTIYLIINRKN